MPDSFSRLLVKPLARMRTSRTCLFPVRRRDEVAIGDKAETGQTAVQAPGTELYMSSAGRQQLLKSR